MQTGRVIYISIIIVLLAGLIGEYYWFTKMKTVEAVETIEENEGVIASIGDQLITEKDFYHYLKDFYGKEALNEMIDTKIVKMAAEKYDIQVDQKDIDLRYKDFIKDFESEKEFSRYLERELGMTKEQLYDYLEFDLLWIELAIKDVNISEDDLLSYYNKNRNNFSEPEKYHLQQIVVSNLEEAKEVVKELENGSDFNTLAKERSLDVLSEATGGDLGYLSVNNSSFSPLIFEKAKSMKLNDIASVQLENNVAVIQLLDYKEEVQYTFEEVKGEVRREIALSKVNSLPEVLQQLKEDIEIKVLDPVLAK